MVGATPIGLYLRTHAAAWAALRDDEPEPRQMRHRGGPSEAPTEQSQHTADLSEAARRLVERLNTHGASFAHELRGACELDADDCYAALGELVAAGLVSSDSFAGLRAIVAPSSRRNDADRAGRWSLLPRAGRAVRHTAAVREHGSAAREGAIETLAWTLLARYGVVFRRVLVRETAGVPWRDLARVYRTLEARGDIRGGRFVAGMSGEQFALPDAVDRLREVRRSAPADALTTIGAADPLNLTGIITPGDRIRTASGNRIVYRHGVPVSALEGDMLRTLGDIDPSIAADVAAAAAGRRVPVVSGYVGRLAT
jgi:ATP-dependent Lhr-like helicase